MKPYFYQTGDSRSDRKSLSSFTWHTCKSLLPTQGLQDDNDNDEAEIRTKHKSEKLSQALLNSLHIFSKVF